MSAATSGIDWDALKGRLSDCRTHSEASAESAQSRLQSKFNERAEALARRGHDDTRRGATTPALAFRVGGETFCLELSCVKQVFPALPVTPAPGAPELLLGVALLNGELRSVIDTGRLLDLTPAATGDGGLVLVRAESGPFALWVDAVDSVRNVDLGALTRSEETSAMSSCSKGLLDDRSVLLDMPALAGRLAERLGRQGRIESL